MKEYTRKLCNKEFDNRTKYWHHTHRKTLCVPKEIVIDELNDQKGKIKLYQKENEIFKEQNQIYEEKLKSLSEELELVKENMIFQNQQKIIYEFNDYSNRLSTTTNINNIGIDGLFKIDISKPDEERLDHIPKELYLEILKCKNLNETMTQLARAVYFNPRAPENYRWCIFDKKAKMGAFEYDHISNGICTKDTAAVIETNMQNVMAKVLTIMDKIKETTPFTHKQIRNYNDLYSAFGTEIENDVINNIKDLAFNDRDLPRVMWKQLNIPLLNAKIKTKIKT